MLSCVLLGNDSRDISRDGLRKRARGSDELTTKRGIYQLTPKDQDLRSLPMVTCVVPRAAAIARWLYPASRAPCTRKRSRLLPAVSRPLQTQSERISASDRMTGVTGGSHAAFSGGRV